MKKEVILQLNSTFEQAACQEDDIEYWMARDLQIPLEYSEWRDFLQVIEKAKTSCQNVGQQVIDHFVNVTKMVKIGSDTEREIEDIMLTRYAWYNIPENRPLADFLPTITIKAKDLATEITNFNVKKNKLQTLSEQVATTTIDIAQKVGCIEAQENKGDMAIFLQELEAEILKWRSRK
jgi:hypothetical protein